MRLQRIFGILGVLLMLAMLGYTVYTRVPMWDPQPVALSPRPYPEPTDPGHKQAFHEVCPAIDRPEVLALVGGAAPKNGQGTSYTRDSLLCNVSGHGWAIRLEVGHNLSIKALKGVTPEGASRTVLGHPALLEASTGRLPRSTLTIARDAADSGDFASIIVFTEVPADEATMVRLAELILPHLAGWTV